jgi:hypothetical protein
MDEADFAKLDLAGKWTHVGIIMNYITTMDQQYDRLQPSAGVSEAYTKLLDKEDKHRQRNIRIDQAQRLAHVKNLYAANRDEMVNTLDNEKWAEYKSILEQVFTAELDDALRDVLED